MVIELLKAILFGIVEGVTEWLPISSTGHLILLDEFIALNVSDEFKSMFDVVIQLGAILAVIVLFFHKLNPFAPSKTAEEKKQIEDAAREIPVFYSGNMSLGIALLCSMTRQAVAMFPEADVEILEIHHNRKVDAPSGTAKMLFGAVKSVRPNAYEHDGRSGECRRDPNEVGISSLRMGNVVGVHEVHIATPSQTITLRHEVATRRMLAEGGVEAARYMAGKPAGLYNMNHLLKDR